MFIFIACYLKVILVLKTLNILTFILLNLAKNINMAFCIKMLFTLTKNNVYDLFKVILLLFIETF